jgi:hypothetical protein
MQASEISNEEEKLCTDFLEQCKEAGTHCKISGIRIGLITIKAVKMTEKVQLFVLKADTEKN